MISFGKRYLCYICVVLWGFYGVLFTGNREMVISIVVKQSVKSFLHFEACLLQQAQQGLVCLCTRLPLLLYLLLQFTLDLTHHLQQFPVCLLPCPFLSVELKMQPVQFLLHSLGQLRCALLPLSGFGAHILFQVEDPLFHFLSDHLHVLCFLVGDLLELVANGDELFVGLLDPGVHFFVALTLLFLNLCKHLVLKPPEFPVESLLFLPLPDSNVHIEFFHPLYPLQQHLGLLMMQWLHMCQFIIQHVQMLL